MDNRFLFLFKMGALGECIADAEGMGMFLLIANKDSPKGLLWKNNRMRPYGLMYWQDGPFCGGEGYDSAVVLKNEISTYFACERPQKYKLEFCSINKSMYLCGWLV